MSRLHFVLGGVLILSVITSCSFQRTTSGSHELLGDCLPGTYLCSGICVEESLVKCDGVEDCDDGADERGCPGRNCTLDEYDCGDGQCIDLTWKCDEIVDCINESDESNCNDKGESSKVSHPRSSADKQPEAQGETIQNDSDVELHHLLYSYPQVILWSLVVVVIVWFIALTAFVYKMQKQLNKQDQQISDLTKFPNGHTASSTTNRESFNSLVSQQESNNSPESRLLD